MAVEDDTKQHNLPNDNDNDEPAETGFPQELIELGNETEEDAKKDVRSGEAPFNPSVPENIGQQDSVGGSESAPETDDDVDEMYERTFGNKPRPGSTIADEINEDEEALRTK